MSWRADRELLTAALRGDGAILDVGCGNGFLLRCLQEWSGYALRPYGIDRRREAIQAARDLFPAERDQFQQADLWQRPLLATTSLPRAYDYVLFGVFDDMSLTTPAEVELLTGLRELTGSNGRLILTLYGPDPATIRARKERLRRLLDGATGAVATADGHVAAIWYDRTAGTAWKCRTWTPHTSAIPPGLIQFAGQADAADLAPELTGYSNRTPIRNKFVDLITGRSSRVEVLTGSAVEVVSMLGICRDFHLHFQARPETDRWRFIASRHPLDDPDDRQARAAAATAPQRQNR